MRRSEAREHIFKMVFGLEFNEKEEMPEQVRLYFEQLEQMEEKDKEYIQKKAWAIADHKDEIDTCKRMEDNTDEQSGSYTA